MKRRTGKKVTMYCLEGGQVCEVDRTVAEIILEVDGMPEEDQDRFLKMIRHMAAKTWPYSPKETKTWKRDRIRGAVDALPDSPAVKVA